jgi:hypothetical protein
MVTMTERPTSSSSSSSLPARRRSSGAVLLLAASWVAVLALAGCGGPSSPADPGGVTPIPTPTPTPTPSATPPPQSAACQLTAPTVNCDTHDPKPQELAPVLQAALDVAVTTPGVMYTEYANKIYNMDLFRSRTIERLTAAGVCGAWDHSNDAGDEIYVRTADGCVVEQYDVIGGDGGVRGANKNSMAWQTGWGQPVPGPRPQYSKYGDLSCPLPGERATFCFSIKGGPGLYGADIYRILVELMNENPALFDKGDVVPGQGEFIPAELRVAAWRILDLNAYIATFEKKLRGQGYCAFIEGGDILRAKTVSGNNILHEEFDVVQSRGTDTYVSFVVKDRCHKAGF